MTVDDPPQFHIEMRLQNGDTKKTLEIAADD